MQTIVYLVHLRSRFPILQWDQRKPGFQGNTESDAVHHSVLIRFVSVVLITVCFAIQSLPAGQEHHT